MGMEQQGKGMVMDMLHLLNKVLGMELQLEPKSDKIGKQV